MYVSREAVSRGRFSRPRRNDSVTGEAIQVVSGALVFVRDGGGNGSEVGILGILLAYSERSRMLGIPIRAPQPPRLCES